MNLPITLRHVTSTSGDNYVFAWWNIAFTTTERYPFNCIYLYVPKTEDMNIRIGSPNLIPLSHSLTQAPTQSQYRTTVSWSAQSALRLSYRMSQSQNFPAVGHLLAHLMAHTFASAYRRTISTLVDFRCSQSVLACMENVCERVSERAFGQRGGENGNEFRERLLQWQQQYDGHHTKPFLQQCVPILDWYIYGHKLLASR